VLKCFVAAGLAPLLLFVLGLEGLAAEAEL
jgi:hypothetical protein